MSDLAVAYHQSIRKMALKYVAAIIVISSKLIQGASFSSVLVQNGADVIPLDYLNYGAPLTSLSQISADPVLSLPQVSAILSPCVSPCVIPNRPVPVAPVTTSARLVTYNPPVNNVPVVVAKKDEARGYQYAYAIFDPTTGDKKTQSEASDGTSVQGQYSFIQPDGVRREVSYTADDLKGFNAVVKNIILNNGDDNTGANDETKPSPCDGKSAKLSEQVDIDQPELSDATDKVELTTTEATASENPADNAIITYNDIINCLQSKLQSPNSISPLTYILVPSLNKPC